MGEEPELARMDTGSESAEDRRAFARIPVDAPATLLLLQPGITVKCTLLELSLEGCSLHAERKLQAAAGMRVEVTFHLEGNAFRLSGVTQWNHGGDSLGIQFAGLSPRREEDLAGALSELAAKQEAEAARRGEQRLHCEQIVRNAKEAVDTITAELGAKAAQEQAARKAAEQAAAEVRQAADQLGKAKAALAAAERVLAEMDEKEQARREAMERVSMPMPAAHEASTKVISAPSPPHGAKSLAAPTAVPGPDGGKPGAGAADSSAQGPTPVPAPAPKPQHGRRERRQETRHAVDTSAVIFLLDVRSRIDGRILDVSPSGCRIRCTDKFPVGIYRRVEVEFVLDGLPFRLPGVTQSLHDRFTTGIRFLNLSERKTEQLLLLMKEISEAQEEADEHPAPAR